MTITLNGKAETIKDGLTVDALVSRLRMKKKGLVVLRNGEVLPEAGWNAALREDDGIELLQFVSGG